MRGSAAAVIKYCGKHASGVELGIYDATNAKDGICRDVQPKVLYMVDPFLKMDISEYDDYGGHNQEDWNELCNKYRALFNIGPDNRGHYLNSEIVFIRERSLDACKTFDDNSIDFVYIDANHSYEFVKNDIVAWYEKVRKGGLVQGHDWTREEVKKAVHECVAAFGASLETDGSGTEWWFVK